MRKLFLVLIGIFLFSGAAFAQPYCSKVRGEVEIYNIPHGHAELKLKRFSPSYIELPITVNPYNGYWEIAIPSAPATWHVTVQYVMDTGYDELGTNGTWNFYSVVGAVQNQVTIVYNDPCTNEDPNDYLPWYFYTKFNSSDVCNGKSFTSRIHDLNSKPGLSGKQVGVNFLINGPGTSWLHVGDPVSNFLGWWTYEIPIGGSGGKCGRYRLDAPPFEWPTYGYNPGMQYVDIFKSSDAVTYAEDYIRTPL